MRDRNVSVVAVVLLALAAAGLAGACSSKSGADCVALCEKASACPGAVSADCETACATEQALAMASGCTSKLDAYTSCSSATDLCTDANTCSGLRGDLTVCVNAYCNDNPSTPGCPTADPAAVAACNDACSLATDDSCLMRCDAVCNIPVCTMGMLSLGFFQGATSVSCDATSVYFEGYNSSKSCKG
jgi:hypothetical protein